MASVHSNVITFPNHASYCFAEVERAKADLQDVAYRCNPHIDAHRQQYIAARDRLHKAQENLYYAMHT